MPLLSRETDKVPDYKEIAGKLHLLDHDDFAIQTLPVFGQIAAQRTCRAHGLEPRPPPLETLPGDVLEIRVGGVAFGHFELREWLGHFFQLHVAALGDVPGTVEGVLHVAEEAEHFLARFQVELGELELHALRVLHGLAGLDAEQDFVGARIAALHVVRVVGGHHGDAGLGGQAA